MVDNALSNALKFSGGVVTLALVDGQGRVQLTVRDQGPGLSVEARERAFEPFYRAAEHRARAGHGIGLALIAHVVAAHGGHARFLDGPGAQLQVELPSHALA
jgi:signal transduction histidine kinase